MSACAEDPKSEHTTPRHNLFMSPAAKPLRLEMAMLVIPLIAIVAMLTLLPPQVPKPNNQNKVKLRVTSVAPPPNFEMIREDAMRREQIRFALAKVAPSMYIAETHPDAGRGTESVNPGQSAGKKQFLALAELENVPSARTEDASPAKKPKLASTRRNIAKSAPRDIRPQSLKRTVAKSAKKSRKNQQAEKLAAKKESWLSASLKWPVAAASATIAPVRETFTNTVSRAGDALESLKQKIL